MEVPIRKTTAAASASATAAVHINMTSCTAMTTERPTMNDELAGTPTAPVQSSSRQAGNEWFCQVMRQASPASSDAARFMAALEA